MLKVQVFPICRDSGISLGLRYLILQTKFDVSLNFFSPKLAGNVKINKSVQTWNSVLLNITNNSPFLNTATLGNLKQQEGLPLLSKKILYTDHFISIPESSTQFLLEKFPCVVVCNAAAGCNSKHLKLVGVLSSLSSV